MAAMVDKERFVRRLSKLYEAWETEAELGSVDALTLTLGTEANSPYSKTLSLQNWLLGYEIQDTVFLFCKEEILFLGSKKKAEFMRPAESEEAAGKVPPVRILVRDKTDKDAANLAKLIKAAKGSGAGKVLGHFAKEAHEGDFTTAWAAAVKEAGLETADVALPVARVLAQKDQLELGFLRTAASVSTKLWTNHLKKSIINLINDDKHSKHERMSKGVEDAMQDRTVVGGVDTKQLEPCFPPIVQSGGKYALKFSVAPDKNPVHFGAIASTFGARYKLYCSGLARTLLVDPSESVEGVYESLLKGFQAVLDALVPGAALADVYEAGRKAFADEQPDLADKLTKSFGFLTGIEFRESHMAISAKSTEKVLPDSVFIVHMGVADVPNPASKDREGKTIALVIGDTVLVKADGPVEVLTEAARRKYKSNKIKIAEDEGEGGSAGDNKENIEETLGRGKRAGVVMTDKSRNKETNEEKRREHQRELMENINEKAKERLAASDMNERGPKVKKSTISYKSHTQLPQDSEVRNLHIFVDKKYETVILPIFGVPVPFHISMIKNCSQSVEGNFTYLRVNFFCPGSVMGRETQAFPNPLATFVKEMTYRSSNLKEPGELSAPSGNLNTAFRLIKEAQKRFKTRETEEREKEGIVKQDKLVLSQNRGNPRLKDLFIRPNMVSKRVGGVLEAHVNGFRYTSIRGDKVDILYTNIKHAFFQPCDHEMIILIHFHLRHPILFGKKKHSDIQVFTEVGEITTDLGKYHHMQDRDDMYAEQAERELRHKLNQAFKGFCDKVERLTSQGVEFDTPFRELGFFGVPHRSSVLLQPTSGALVNLAEWPAFVVTLDEVELVHFERVSFQLKNFDMVFIFKDYKRKVDMVQQIPMAKLDNVKEWLDSCEIRYTEGIQSLNWPKVMKTIVDDPDSFFEDGGWNFLASAADDEEGEDDDDDSEDDEYKGSASEGSGSGSASEESEGSDDESPEATSESDSEASTGSDEESGKDWSDLEEEARKADKERSMDVEPSASSSHKERSHKDKSHKDSHKSHKRKHSRHSSPSPSPKKHKKSKR